MAADGLDSVLAGSRLGVVVVSHQQEHLTECLQSVLGQTVTPSDIVLVDNASAPECRASAIAAEMGLPTVRLDRSVSLATARNVGCEVLDDCDYIVSLDGDDILEPRYVEVYWAEAIRRQCDVVHGPAQLFGSMTGVEFTPRTDGKRRDLRKGNFIPANSLFSRAIWRSAGGFDARLSFYEDWDFWLSCAEQGAKFHCVDEVLWRYRRHAMSMLATADEHEKDRSRRYIRNKHLSYIRGPLQWCRVKRKIEKTVLRPRS